MGAPVSIIVNTVGATPWKNLDWYRNPFAAEIDCTVTGTVTFNLELTNSDYLTPGTTVIVQPTTVVAASASVRYALTSPTRAWRINMTAGTGSIAVEAIQAGL
jgi:hypothetical protein